MQITARGARTIPRPSTRLPAPGGARSFVGERRPRVARPRQERPPLTINRADTVGTPALKRTAAREFFANPRNERTRDFLAKVLPR